MSTPKTSTQLYRDCLRLVRHMAGASSPKAAHLSRIVGAQFRANAGVVAPEAVHALKQAAERSLSSYLLFQRAKMDPKIAAAAVHADAFEDDEHGNLVGVRETVDFDSREPREPEALPPPPPAAEAAEARLAEQNIAFFAAEKFEGR